MNLDSLFGGIYKNKNILVTGHTGFKGSWLTSWLEQLGARVAGYARAPETQPNHWDLLSSNARSTIADISEFEKLCDIFNHYKPEIIFHLAAQPLVRYSYENPIETYQTNVMGTLHVCEAARQCDSVRAIVSITTDKVYENNEWPWGYRENDRLGGYDPYSSSKACAEILLAGYRCAYFNTKDYGKSHNVLLAAARAGNVIGGGDWSQDRLIPDIMKACAKGAKSVIRNPAAVRPWQHVLECLSGYLLIGAHLMRGDIQAADVFNFGPESGDTLPVDAIAERIKKLWDIADYDFPQRTGEPHEAGLLRLDCSKAQAVMGWKPIWNIEIALRQTVNWYRSYYEKGETVTIEDIEKYCRDAQKKDAVWA